MSKGAAQIGHVALHEILSHERSAWNYLVEKHYQGGSAGYKTLMEIDPDLFEQARERWQETRKFSNWAMDAYRRQIDGLLEGGSSDE